ncbi:MAG: hypothetical protein QOH79_1592 [Acidimicrobiaceae bacterium]
MLVGAIAACSDSKPTRDETCRKAGEDFQSRVAQIDGRTVSGEEFARLNDEAFSQASAAYPGCLARFSVS